MLHVIQLLKTLKHQQKQEENMETQHRKTPGPNQGLNPGPSREATVLLTTPPCSIAC